MHNFSRVFLVFYSLFRLFTLSFLISTVKILDSVSIIFYYLWNTHLEFAKIKFKCVDMCNGCSIRPITEFDSSSWTSRRRANRIQAILSLNLIVMLYEAGAWLEINSKLRHQAFHIFSLSTFFCYFCKPLALSNHLDTIRTHGYFLN